MLLQFFRSKPIQATKLGVIVTTLLVVTTGVYGPLSDGGLAGLFLVVVLGVALVFVVGIETVFAGYHLLRTDESVAVRVGDRPLYALVRAIEVGTAAITAGGIVFLFVTLPDGPMSGPGAIGLLFLLLRYGLVVIGGSGLRTLVEFYDVSTPD